MSLGDLIAFLAVLALARGQLNWVAGALPDLLTGLAAIERIDAVLENDEREPYRGGADRARGAVAWEGVTFGYSREEPPVLRRVCARGRARRDRRRSSARPAPARPP